MYTLRFHIEIPFIKVQHFRHLSLTLQSDAELEDYKRSIKDKLAKVQTQALKRTIQPFPAVIGPNTLNLDDTRSVVVINDTTFQVGGPIEAVDFCFKAYHSLHAYYPHQSEAPWLFLQKAIYEITTPWDSKVSAVSTLTNEFSKLVVVS